MSAALKRIALVGILAAIAGMAARPYAEDLVRSTLALHAIEPCCSLVNIEHETIALFERASPSVVEVTTITTSGGGSSTSSIKTGSGFFWDTSGNIVTNAHVVDDATVIRVWLPSGEPVEAETVGSAPTYDLAVIRPKEPLKVPSDCNRHIKKPKGRAMGIRAGKSVRARSIPDDGRNQRSQAGVADKQRSRGWQYHSNQRCDLSRELRRTPSGFIWSPHWCEYGCLLNSGVGLRPGICHPDRHCKRYRAQPYQQWSDTSTRYWRCSRRRRPWSSAGNSRA